MQIWYKADRFSLYYSKYRIHYVLLVDFTCDKNVRYRGLVVKPAEKTKTADTEKYLPVRK